MHRSCSTAQVTHLTVECLFDLSDLLLDLLLALCLRLHIQCTHRETSPATELQLTRVPTKPARPAAVHAVLACSIEAAAFIPCPLPPSCGPRRHALRTGYAGAPHATSSRPLLHSIPSTIHEQIIRSARPHEVRPANPTPCSTTASAESRPHKLHAHTDYRSQAAHTSRRFFRSSSSLACISVSSRLRSISSAAVKWSSCVVHAHHSRSPL